MRARLPDGSVIISGFLAKDAEYKQVGGNNSSLTKFAVKVGERQPKVQGERGEAVWVSCQCWHSVARATKALKKFDVVLCVGKVEKKPYTSKDGEEKSRCTSCVRSRFCTAYRRSSTPARARR